MGLDNTRDNTTLAEGAAPQGAKPETGGVLLTESMLSNPHSLAAQREFELGRYIRAWFADNLPRIKRTAPDNGESE